MTRICRTALRPALEVFEPRSLLSALTYMAAASPPPVQVTASLLESRHVLPNKGSASGGQSSGGIGSIGQGGAPLIGQGQPTARELARDTFHGYFNGPVTAGPGRFSDQAEILYVRGVGGSNFFRHGDMNLGIVVPTDRTASSTGFVYVQDKNINSGGALGLDLTAVSGAVDRRGRPTQFTFVADPNIYSGIFFVDSSTGTLDVVYRGSTATVRINGLVYTSGLTNPLKNTDLVERGGVPFLRG
jgi:hypothetical protein